jgi:hypothetical protein
MSNGVHVNGKSGFIITHTYMVPVLLVVLVYFRYFMLIYFTCMLVQHK